MPLVDAMEAAEDPNMFRIASMDDPALSPVSTSQRLPVRRLRSGGRVTQVSTPSEDTAAAEDDPRVTKYDVSVF